MVFQSTPGQYNPDLHLEILRSKRRTVAHFAKETGILLARVAGQKDAGAWSSALEDLLAFDIDQSIAICEQQKQGLAAALKSRLDNLEQARDKLTKELESAREGLASGLREQSGNEPSPHLVAQLVAPLRMQIEAIEAEMSTTMQQIEALPPAAPGA
jgi:hypothetical protein